VKGTGVLALAVNKTLT